MTVAFGYCTDRKMLPALRTTGLADRLIWLEGRGAETLDRCLALAFRGRPGKLFVAPGLTVFGDARKDVLAVMARLESARIRVVDIIHPQDQTVSDMIRRAVDAIGNSRFRDKRTARRRGRAGGLARGITAANKRAEIAADWVIKNIVNDPDVSWSQAHAFFDGKISMASLRRHFYLGAS